MFLIYIGGHQTILFILPKVNIHFYYMDVVVTYGVCGLIAIHGFSLKIRFIHKKNYQKLLKRPDDCMKKI